MLKIETDFIREFPVVSRTDRDCEIPVLMDFIGQTSLRSDYKVESLLDIGAHSTGKKYAPDIRKSVTRYDGIDIASDPETAAILDKYWVGNANDHEIRQGDTHIPLLPYDMVICVSTIEHAGLSTYQGNYVEERHKLFETCLLLSKKYLWISFPVGIEYVYPGQLAPITDKQLTRWEKLTSNFKVKERFFYNQGPQAGHPWYEHTKREVAVKIPYIDFAGNQSICVMEIEK